MSTKLMTDALQDARTAVIAATSRTVFDEVLNVDWYVTAWMGLWGDTMASLFVDWMAA